MIQSKNQTEVSLFITLRPKTKYAAGSMSWGPAIPLLPAASSRSPLVLFYQP